MRRWLAAAVVTVVVAGCGGQSHSAAHRPSTGQPDPYDVAAARACEAFDRFVNDVKGNTPNQKDSSAFDTALTNLQTGHSPTDRWAPLVSDLNNFLVDGQSNNSTALVADGQAAGQECVTIPQAAKIAGGFT